MADTCDKFVEKIIMGFYSKIYEILDYRAFWIFPITWASQVTWLV